MTMLVNLKRALSLSSLFLELYMQTSNCTRARVCLFSSPRRSVSSRPPPPPGVECHLVLVSFPFTEGMSRPTALSPASSHQPANALPLCTPMFAATLVLASTQSRPSTCHLFIRSTGRSSNHIRTIRARLKAGFTERYTRGGSRCGQQK